MSTGYCKSTNFGAIKFGVSQTKNDLAAIQFGMSPSSFLLILTFPHLLGQIYYICGRPRLGSLQGDPILFEHEYIGL